MAQCQCCWLVLNRILSIFLSCWFPHPWTQSNVGMPTNLDLMLGPACCCIIVSWHVRMGTIIIRIFNSILRAFTSDQCMGNWINVTVRLKDYRLNDLGDGWAYAKRPYVYVYEWRMCNIYMQSLIISTFLPPNHFTHRRSWQLNARQWLSHDNYFAQFCQGNNVWRLVGNVFLLPFLLRTGVRASMRRSCGCGRQWLERDHD